MFGASVSLATPEVVCLVKLVIKSRTCIFKPFNLRQTHCVCKELSRVCLKVLFLSSGKHMNCHTLHLFTPMYGNPSTQTYGCLFHYSTLFSKTLNCILVCDRVEAYGQLEFSLLLRQYVLFSQTFTSFFSILLNNNLEWHMLYFSFLLFIFWSDF